MPTPPNNQVQRTVQVISEGIVYEAANKNRKELERMLEKIIKNSIFLDNKKKQLYLKPLGTLSTDILCEFKDIFIRRNLAYLKYLVENKLVEKRMIAKLT